MQCAATVEIGGVSVAGHSTDKSLISWAVVSPSSDGTGKMRAFN